MDLAFGDAVAPRHGETGCDGGEVVLESTGEASQLFDSTVDDLGHPRLEVMAPALPDEVEKGLAQRMHPCDARIPMAELVEIRLSVTRLLRGGAHHDERHRAG